MFIRLSRHLFLHIGLILSVILSFSTPYQKIYLLTVFAAFLHECCHLAVAFFLKVPIRRLELLPYGMSLRLARMDVRAEGLITLAGPVASFFFAWLFGPYKAFSVIHFRLFLFNLLPALPLDGGRLLRLFFWQQFGFIRGHSMTRRISAAVAVMLFLLGIYAHAFSLWIAVFIIAADLYCAPPPMSPLLIKKTSKTPKTKLVIVSEKDSLLHLLRYYSPCYKALFCVLPSRLLLEENVLTSYLRTHGAQGKVYALPPALFRTDFLQSRGEIPRCKRKKSPK